MHRNKHDDVEVARTTGTRYFRRSGDQIGELIWHGEPYASSVGINAWGRIERTESFEDAVQRGLSQEQ